MAGSETGIFRYTIEGMCLPLDPGSDEEGSRGWPEADIREEGRGPPPHQEASGTAFPPRGTHPPGLRPSETVDDRMPAMDQLFCYVEDQWIHNTLWAPEEWSIYRQNVRTNNDVEGNILQLCKHKQVIMFVYISVTYDV